MKNLYIAVLCLMIGTAHLTAQEAETPVESVSPFFITANVNYAYRLGKVPDGANQLQEDYIKKLKSGVSLDFGAYYRVNESFAIGGKYNVYKSKMTINNVMMEFTPAGDSGVGSITDDITISYYGVGIMYIDEAADPHVFTAEISLGYMDYNNDAVALGDYNYSGSSVGLTLSANYKYKLSKNFSIGPQLTFVGGALTKFDLTGPRGYEETIKLDSETPESLSRLDIGLSATYNF